MTGVCLCSIKDMLPQKRQHQQLCAASDACRPHAGILMLIGDRGVCSIKDMLLQKRMDRQLRAARGELEPERPPGEVQPSCSGPSTWQGPCVAVGWGLHTL